MYLYRQGKEIHAAIGEFLFGKFSFYEDIPGNKYDEQCFSCREFNGCNEPGDILCVKDGGVRDSKTIRDCKKNNWFLKNKGENE